MLKAIKQIPFILLCCFALWFFISYCEILVKHLNHPVYSNYNLITMIINNVK